jgi:hypothetical protein
MPVYQITSSLSTIKRGGMYDDDDNDDDDDPEETVQFMPPKYVPEIPIITPKQSSAFSMSMQKV